jgi:mannose-6-phosphate isomerase-like protein (cupin superfamily)
VRSRFFRRRAGRAVVPSPRQGSERYGCTPAGGCPRWTRTSPQSETSAQTPSRSRNPHCSEEFDQFEPPADGGRPLSDAVFRSAGEGQSVTIGESSAVLKTDRPDVGGFFSLAERILAPGFHGPALNAEGAVATFFVLGGTLSLQLGDEQVNAGPGAFGLAPPRNVPTFANTSEELVRVLEVGAPAQPAATGRSAGTTFSAKR